MRFLIYVPFILLLFACNSSSERASKGQGEILAQEHCASCHQLPSPEQLDKQTWASYILPRMGYMLGMGLSDSVERVLYEPGLGGDKVRASGLFPKEAMLGESEWQEIKDYFISKAPERLPLPSLAPLQDSLTGFEVHIPQTRLSPPSSTLVQVAKDGGIFLGDAHTKSLLKFNSDYDLERAAQLKEGLVHLIEEKGYLYLTLMGSFSPTDDDKGMFLFLPKVDEQEPEVVIPSLGRPVHTALADLNGDSAKDILISEFGKWTGELVWWKNGGAKGLEKHVLKAKPGATKTHILDSNGDEKLDVLALFAQGDEGVFLFENSGNDNFKEKKLISFPPSYGLSSMEVLDWNGDGAMDLLICSGDNADYPALVKPYHGIYLFLNDGQFNFFQKWFYALPGAYGTQVRDFDQDGDLDIAAISFFPDFEAEKPRSFVYLENDGTDTFHSATFSGASQMGRWIVMDAGDIDQDGDEDIVLGSLAFEVPNKIALVNAWTESGIPFIVLENRLKP